MFKFIFVILNFFFFVSVFSTKTYTKETGNQSVVGKGLVCNNTFWNTNTNDYELDPNKPQTKKYYYFVDSNSVKVFRIKGNDINSYRRDYTLHKTDEVRIKGDITLDRETLEARIGWFGSTYLCEGYGSEREVLSIIENDIEEGMRKNKF